MPSPFKSLFMCCLLACLTGCNSEDSGSTKQNTKPRNAVESQKTSTELELSPEQQAALDRLNSQAASEPWLSEVDMIERPEIVPKNYKPSGEVAGFIDSSKRQLAKLGVQVNWDADKKRYVVESVER